MLRPISYSRGRPSESWVGIAPGAPLDGARIEHFLSPEQIQVYQRHVLPTVMRDGHWLGRTQVQAGADCLPVDCTVLAHRDVRGRIETVSVIMRDVSEQARAQRAAVMQVHKRRRCLSPIRGV